MNITPEKFKWLVENVDPTPFYQGVMAAAQDPSFGTPQQDPLSQALTPAAAPMPQPGVPPQQPQIAPIPQQPVAMPQPGMMQGGLPPQVPRGMAPVPQWQDPLKRGF